MEEMERLIEPCVPALRRFAASLLRDDAAADDLVQDCLERAVSRWHLRRRDGNLQSWLFTILFNIFANQRRGARRRGTSVPLEEWDGAPSGGEAGSEAEGRLGLRDVLAGLAALPDEQRAVLLLVGVEDLSYEEAARVAGVPVGTVMSRLSRGRERLRRLVEGEVRPYLRRVK